MKHLRLCIIMLVILAAVPAVRADMMDPSKNHKPFSENYNRLVFVDSCFEITNQNQYPDYLFIVTLTHASTNGSYRVVSTQDCIPRRYISKPFTDSPTMYAIKKSDFASWDHSYNYYDNHLLHSDYDVFEPSWYSDNPDVKITYFLNISFLNSTRFDLSRERWDIVYSNGTTQSYPSKTSLTHAPATIPETPVAEIPPYVSLSCIAGALITGIFLWRRKTV